MRVYKVKVFARFQRRERIADKTLAKAVKSAEQGGASMPISAAGSSSSVWPDRAGARAAGYRTVIAYRHGDLAVYLLGFAKNERANIDDDELEDLRGQAQVFFKLTEDQIEAAIAENELTEVSYGDEE